MHPLSIATRRNTHARQNTKTYKENKMGLNFATELSAMDTMPIEAQLNMHLQYNFYPPIPSSMVQPCIDAIDAYADDDIYRDIEMPQGVSYRGSNFAPAHAIVEQHRLGPWCEVIDWDDE
jgi:hypothetical protein